MSGNTGEITTKLLIGLALALRHWAGERRQLRRNTTQDAMTDAYAEGAWLEVHNGLQAAKSVAWDGVSEGLGDASVADEIIDNARLRVEKCERASERVKTLSAPTEVLRREAGRMDVARNTVQMLVQ